MSPTPTEAQIESAIREAFILKHRIALYKTDAGGAGYRSGLRKGARCHGSLPVGFPDLIGCEPGTGRIIAIECKRPGYVPTKAQAEFLDHFQRCGAISFWADSVDHAFQQYQRATAQK